ncbi:hypothetical protein SVAN01_00147 [Stagonosporopsis vannaccii]|nr:hypothetical protein SVAN01_00147 [Stagonosporopsis vannaccii]
MLHSIFDAGHVPGMKVPHGTGSHDLSEVEAFAPVTGEEGATATFSGPDYSKYAWKEEQEVSAVGQYAAASGSRDATVLMTRGLRGRLEGFESTPWTVARVAVERDIFFALESQCGTEFQLRYDPVVSQESGWVPPASMRALFDW